MASFPKNLPGFFPQAVREWYGHLDLGSLKIRLWLYFGLFSVILIVLLWILQIAFLNYSYENMKISETRNIASQIEARIQKEGLSADTRDFINNTCRGYEMYIQIETKSGIRLFMPNIDTSVQSGQATDAAGNAIEQLPSEGIPSSYYPTIYRKEIETLKTDLTVSGNPNFSKQTLEPNTDQKTLEYASFLTTPALTAPTAPGDVGTIAPDIIPKSPDPASVDPLMLFIFSPLYPMGSTINILTTQLVYVTIIALLLAVLLGFYLSRMITRPIVQIAKRAEELGDGNFGIDFPETHYSEIQQLAETLSYTSATLAETRNMQRDIIANVSHDLRTPLTMIRSYAEMITDFSGENPEKRNAHLQVIINETDRLTAMISELLDISKLQSGEIIIKYTDFSLKDLIEAMIASYSAAIEQDGYKLVLVSMGEGVIRADEMRI
ncbi:MAG: HAMP domain-containing histidine kinase, partial [Clostridiales bacterium]|nr:HAMP domain-containing histidine kinase [Clostridiales bacterium]